MVLDIASLKVPRSVKQRFDRIADINGGLTQSRLFEAMLEVWDRVDDDTRRDAITATAKQQESSRPGDVDSASRSLGGDDDPQPSDCQK